MYYENGDNDNSDKHFKYHYFKAAFLESHDTREFWHLNWKKHGCRQNWPVPDFHSFEVVVNGHILQNLDKNVW